MDFSTMRKKMNQDDYSNILEFRSDFELMCDNAMKYNRPDTIYWQAAKKLLATGTKLMHKDKLISFRRSLECFSRLTERELGFRIDSSNHAIDEQSIISNEQNDSSINEHENLSSISVSQACSQRKPKLILKLPKFYEKTSVSIPDEDDEEELSPEEILLQAQQAAQCAREKLNLRRPISLYTLAYQRVNSTTSLRYVNQDDFTKQIINISELNNLSSKENGLPIVHENDKRYYLENGPFSSNPSQYDSPFSSISKEELDLLIHTYGSEFSAQYAVSLMDYVKDSGDLALAYVDRFLSVLTNGEHDNFTMKRREKQQKEEENDNKTVEIGLSSDQIKLEPQIHTNDNIQHQQLDTKLYQQHPNEYELAEKDLFNLSDITQMSNGPEQIISSETIHDNLGIINNNESTFDTL
jgi:bromodomain-containing protein 7/9